MNSALHPVHTAGTLTLVLSWPIWGVIYLAHNQEEKINKDLYSLNQPQHYWQVGLDSSLMGVSQLGDVCPNAILGGLVGSRASTH